MDDLLLPTPEGATLLTSRANPHIRRLDDLLHKKKVREESGLFALEGRRLCLDAQAAGVPLQQLFVTPSACRKAPEALRPLLEGAGQVLWLEEDLARRIGDTQSPQGLFAVCPAPDFFRALPVGGPGRHLLLYQVRDPGNLGSILRTAAALGAESAHLCDCAEVLSPKVLRAAMGGVWRLPVMLHRDPFAMVALLQGAGVPVFAAALAAGAGGPEQLAGPEGLGLLVGNEGSGLPPELIAACRGVVTLPMQGGIDSLGAAMAAGILLWEMCK